MKLTGFGEAIARVEAERMAEAKAAVAAGWTEADHPDKCCPQDAPQPKRVGRSVAEVERLRIQAANKARWWATEAIARQQILANHEANQGRFDHGMLQVDLKVRQRSANRGQRLWKELEHANERTDHFRNLVHKYAAQLSRRTD